MDNGTWEVLKSVSLCANGVPKSKSKKSSGLSVPVTDPKSVQVVMVNS